MEQGMHQPRGRDIQHLPDAQEFQARGGPVLAFNFGNVGLMDSGLRGNFFLR
jgi:hypothetical protein